MRRVWRAIPLLVSLADVDVAASAAKPGAGVLVDGFEDTAAWSAHPADGVELSIRPDTGAEGRAMRLDFRFLRGGGYAVARRAVDLDLPENYAFSFSIRGEAPRNHLEFKLIDSTGENVWWSVRRDVEFPRTWQTFTLKRRQIQFAWGPAGGGEIRHVAAIELAITAGSGGEGTVWIDDLALRPLAPPGAAPPAPVATSSSSTGGHGPSAALDGDAGTFWSSRRGDRRQWIALDLRESREYGGLVLDWEPGRHLRDYAVEASDDGRSWRGLRTVRGGNGGRDWLDLPESESRHLRIRALRTGRGAGPAGGPVAALREIAIQPLEWAATREAFFQAIARDAPRGTYPRAFSGEQSYWTVVGADSDRAEALLGEDGMLETGKRAFSVEPFLHAGGALLGWGEARTSHSLLEGRLPVPIVRREYPGLDLTVTAFDVGSPGASSVVARYRVRNTDVRRVRATFFLALRPFQVNPPTQFLNTPGGCAPISDLGFDGREIVANGGRAIVCLTRPSAFGATTFDAGDVVADFLRDGRLPPERHAEDPTGAASGALAYRLDLPPGGEHEVDLLIPLHRTSEIPRLRDDPAGRAWVASALAACRGRWAADLSRATIRLPDSASEVVRTLESQIAWIRINRAGPAIQPGTRAYARSWIRDGSLTSSALLRLGHPEPVRDFLEWFAPNQFENGRIPCCVDARGPDPVPENDSGGEFLFLVAEYFRYTGDRALLEQLWPRVERAAAFLDSLRRERRTDEYRRPGKEVFFGLLPQSISHEGYSAKPMHSYWDDFFALRGFRDAAWIAEMLGREPERRRLEAVRDEFERDLTASIATAMRTHAIDYVPGCAELGDFDATSTTIAITPAGAEALLPEGALRRTFERYWEFFEGRRAGAPWEAFTPYEMRSIGAFVRLGWRERAQELLEFFLAARRPAGWAEWAEVVWRDPRAPRFIGDMPHTWVGSDYARSVLDMLAFPREDGSALVIGAGVPSTWIREAPGVEVRNLPTPFGPVSFTVRGAGDTTTVRIEGGLRPPPGGIQVRVPIGPEIRAVSVNGRPAALGPEGEVVVREVPATVLLHP